MEKLHKLVNGKKVYLNDQEIAEHTLKEDDYESKAGERAVKAVRQSRASRYPKIGDQIDALYKYLETVTGDNEVKADSPLDNMIKTWKRVKSDNPYPTK